MATRSIAGRMHPPRTVVAGVALALAALLPREASGQATCPSAALPQLAVLAAPFVEALHSVNSNVATNVCFSNLLSTNVNVYWIDFGPDGVSPGAPVFYNMLQAGQSYWQQTYVTHPWLITDAITNAAIEGFLPIASNAEADIVPLVVATPEPSQLVLLGTGLCLMVGAGVRRRRD